MRRFTARVILEAAEKDDPQAWIALGIKKLGGWRQDYATALDRGCPPPIHMDGLTVWDIDEALAKLEHAKVEAAKITA